MPDKTKEDVKAGTDIEPIVVLDLIMPNGKRIRNGDGGVRGAVGGDAEIAEANQALDRVAAGARELVHAELVAVDGGAAVPPVLIGEMSASVVPV